MNFKPVSSSFIDGIAYDATTGTMHVKFANGSVQEHSATKEEYSELLNAESVGSHYNKNYRGAATKPVKPIEKKWKI